MATNWSRARTLLPVAEYDPDGWAEHWANSPDIFTRMLGDLYRVYKSEQAKAAGTANPKGGRRRASIDGNVHELFAILTPTFATKPFPEALREAMGEMSQRELARRSGVQQAAISHWLRGLPSAWGEPDRYDMERIAKGLGVHPAYFVEWRIDAICALTRKVLTVRPHLSITLLKGLSR